LDIVNRAGGDVAVISDGLLQRDSWTYERAKADGARWIGWNGWTHPIPASVEQLSTMRMAVNAAGQLKFGYQAHRGETIAFVRRDVQTITVMPKTTPSQSSPLRDLARTDYLSVGGTILGEQRAPGSRWNTVVIQKITTPSDR
jgi:hypothetical protein